MTYGIKARIHMPFRCRSCAFLGPQLAKMESRNILNFREKGAPGTVGRNLPKRQRLKEPHGVFLKTKESGGPGHRFERRQGRGTQGPRERPRLSTSERGPR